ncbi:MAG: adenylosuccinate lyase [Patescibacteria group bacterium]
MTPPSESAHRPGTEHASDAEPTPESLDRRALWRVDSVGPIDGRYRRDTEALAEYFSEHALMEYRVRVESEYFLALHEEPALGLEPLTEEEVAAVRELGTLAAEDAHLIKQIEVRGHDGNPATKHDVKAVEYFMKHRLAGKLPPEKLEWVHFGLTSEDVNNMAYALMLRDATNRVMLPEATNVLNALEEQAERYADLPMLARTHGQPASPTTLGKEFRVFAERFGRQLGQIERQTLQVKLNGATGNYNAHLAAFPEFDWEGFAERFVRRASDANSGVRLELNYVTTQIESHDSYAELFDAMRRLNTVLLDFDQDMWRYISDGWLVERPEDGATGSSTMPHKVNPINFENSEGNIGIANALFEHFGRKLPVSRLQRDLSDSTVERNFGVAFAHSLVAYKNTLKGLAKVEANGPKIEGVLEAHPEVVAEAIQTVLRSYGVERPYELLKEATRGREVTQEILDELVDSLDLPEDRRAYLKGFKPREYVGIAAKLARGEAGETAT